LHTRAYGISAEALCRNARANSWGYGEIDSGHDVMVTDPKKLADLLLKMLG
jgi:hypothetical protein